MTTITVPAGGDWRSRFRAFEMKFFEISAADWPAKFFQTIKKITGDNYPAAKHALHVDLLNQTFSLNPPLTTDDFGKGATLQEVQDDEVAPRLPFATNESEIDIEHSAAELHVMGLGHLLSGGGK